jgi:hypothetical protein
MKEMLGLTQKNLLPQRTKRFVTYLEKKLSVNFTIKLIISTLA